MTYDDFKITITQTITQHLPLSFQQCRPSIITVTKNNNRTLDGLLIGDRENSPIPTIYLNEFYRSYEDGMSMNEILDKIAKIRVDYDRPPESFPDFTDAAKILPLIVCRVINREQNKDFLKEHPFRAIEDLAVTYHIVINGEEQNSGFSCCITNDLLKSYAITPEELHHLAVENMLRRFPSTLQGIGDVICALRKEQELSEFFSPSEVSSIENSFYILSHKGNTFGAAACLDHVRLQKIFQELGPYFLLPSSVHEFLVVPKCLGCSAGQLESMVREVNRTQVDPEDRLSDHVYEYAPDIGTFRLCRE